MGINVPRRRTATHWGVYEVGDTARPLTLRPLQGDPDPACIADPVAGAGHARTRVLKPAVRRSYLDRGPRRGQNRRGSEPFVELEWDDALDLAAAELDRVKAECGNEAIYAGSYGWASAGRFHHAQSQVHRFLRCFGGYTDSVNSYSMAAAEVLLPHVIGQSAQEHYAALPTWHELAAHTELVVAFGGLPLRNTQINAGGVGRHLAREGQQACRAAGVEFVSVSPVRDDTSALLAARSVAPRPGTDVALMLALAKTIIDADLHDRGFLERCCIGFSPFSEYLDGERDGIPKGAGWAADITGVRADEIRRLAVQIATRPTFITVAWALQRAHHGEQPLWAGFALAAIAGQLGRQGGGCAIGYSSVHSLGASAGRSRVGALPQPPNPVTTSIPVARVSDMLLHPGTTIAYDGATVTYPEIELIYWCGGNPFHHHQDLNRLRRAWQRPATVIVHEPYWNALAKHAEIVFPCTTPIEREDLSAGDKDRHLTAMHKLAEPTGAARDDYAIFSDLASRLGIQRDVTEGRTAREWLEALYADTRVHAQSLGADLPPFAEFWEAGEALLPVPAGPREWPLARFRADPAGHPLATPSGRIEIASERIASFGYADCPGQPTWLEPAEWAGANLAERFPLHLLSCQPRVRLHSQHDQGSTSQAIKVHGREPLRIHPRNAADRAILDGDAVRVYNDRGSCIAGAVISSDVAPGVIQLATGAWYDPADPDDPDSLEVHGNPNVLTLDIGTSLLAQGPSAQTTLVEVELLRGPLPALRAYEPPAFVE